MSDKPEKWTVSCRETTVQNKLIPKTNSYGREEKRFTWWLHYDGSRVHSLDGSRGEDILRDIARKWNAEGYEPKMVKGKIYMDLTSKEKLNLAMLCSPKLPFEEEAK